MIGYPPSVHVGSGVPKVEDAGSSREDDEAAKKEDTYPVFLDFSERMCRKGPDGAEYILNRLGEPAYSSKPITERQYANPHLWKAGPVESIVLDLSDPEQLKSYNRFIATSRYPDPSVVITVDDRHFHEGRFYTFLTYSRIWYALPTKDS